MHSNDLEVVVWGTTSQNILGGVGPDVHLGLQLTTSNLTAKC